MRYLPSERKSAALVRDGVLAAQFVLNLGEGVGHVFNLEGEKRLAAGLIGKVLQHFVAAQLDAAGVGRDGVDDRFGAQRHFQRFPARDAALIVLAVTQPIVGAARGDLAFVDARRLVGEQADIDGVVHGRAAAGAQHPHTVR